MSKTNQVNKKVVCSLLIVLLATSLVLVTLMFDDSTLLVKGKSVLDVQITGPSKLGVTEPGEYVASVNGELDATGTYVWSISPDDGKTTLTSTGYTCTVTFVEATLEPYLLSVSVSKAGAIGFDVFTLYDPVTLPDYHLAVASNPYNYMIAADGLGWYYVVNGTSGAVVTSGTNQSALEISTYAYGAGTVVLNQLQHNSSATVPSTVTVIQNYQGTVTYYGNHVASNYASTQPMGDYTYMIYVDPTNSSLYNAKHSNGTICWTSTNKTSVLVSVADAASYGNTVIALTGVFGTKSCTLYVGNVTATLNSGEVAYQSSENQYAKASASANSTIGYGYVWLTTFNVVAGDSCLFMDSGIYTLGTWSLSSGLAWVSTTGTVTSTYPSSTGDQLCSIGSYVNATTINVENPKGYYMQHG